MYLLQAADCCLTYCNHAQMASQWPLVWLCTWCYILTKRPLVAQALANKRCIKTNVIGTLNLLPEELTLTFPAHMPLLLQLHRETELTSSSHQIRIFVKGLDSVQYGVSSHARRHQQLQLLRPRVNYKLPTGSHNMLQGTVYPCSAHELCAHTSAALQMGCIWAL